VFTIISLWINLVVVEFMDEKGKKINFKNDS